MNLARQLAALGATPEMIRNTLVDGRLLADFDERLGGVVVGRVHREPGRVCITIPGPAPGKPRMNRGDKWKKRPACVRYWDWCDLVRSIAGDVPAAESVWRLSITAYFEPPKSWSKRKRWHVVDALKRHYRKPDADNVAKSVMDCLWPDSDSGIADVDVRKRWDWNARLEIEIVINSRAAAGGE